MTRMFTPAEACAVVAEATGFPLDPDMLRRWRHRGILRKRAEEEGGWTRYSFLEVFELCALADIVAQTSMSIGDASSLAGSVANYAPGCGGFVDVADDDPDGGYALLLTVKPVIGENGPAGFKTVLPIRVHVTEAHKLFSPSVAERMGGNSAVFVAVTQLRKRFKAAVGHLPTT